MNNNTKNELKIPNIIKNNKEELLKFRNYYEMIRNSSRDLKTVNQQNLMGGSQKHRKINYYIDNLFLKMNYFKNNKN